MAQRSPGWFYSASMCKLCWQTQFSLVMFSWTFSGTTYLIEGIKIFCFPSCLVNLSMTLFVRLGFLFHIIKDHNSSFRMCPSADLFFTELQFNLNLVTHEFLCNSFQMLSSAPGIRSTHGSSSCTDALPEFENNFTLNFLSSLRIFCGFS